MTAGIRRKSRIMNQKRAVEIIAARPAPRSTASHCCWCMVSRAIMECSMFSCRGSQTAFRRAKRSRSTTTISSTWAWKARSAVGPLDAWPVPGRQGHIQRVQERSAGPHSQPRPAPPGQRSRKPADRLMVRGPASGPSLMSACGRLFTTTFSAWSRACLATPQRGHHYQDTPEWPASCSGPLGFQLNRRQPPPSGLRFKRAAWASLAGPQPTCSLQANLFCPQGRPTAGINS